MMSSASSEPLEVRLRQWRDGPKEADAFIQELQSLKLAYPRYSKFFIDYDSIGKVLEEAKAKADVLAQANRTGEGKADAQKEVAAQSQELAKRLQAELAKVNDIVELEWEVINNELKSRKRQEQDSKSKQPIKDWNSLNNLAESVIMLSIFVDANLNGFRQVVKQCESVQGTSYAWFLAKVEAAPFKRNFDVVLAQIGHFYGLLRKKYPLEVASFRRQAGKATEASLPAEEVRTFVVPANRIMRTKALILRHFRVWGTEEGSKDFGPFHLRSAPGAPAFPSEVKRPVTCVYFDNAEGDQYKERRQRLVERTQGAENDDVFRCRWVGENNGGSDFEVAVDTESSPPCDVTLGQRDVRTLVAGTLNVPAAARSYGLNAQQEQALSRVLGTIQRRRLRPVLSASFSCTTYLQDGASTRSVTLEEDITFRKESPGSDAKTWCTAVGQQETAPSVTAIRGVAGAILRVYGGEGSGPLLSDLMSLESELRELPCFSKALHGTAILRPALAQPGLPWLPEGDPSAHKRDRHLSDWILDPAAAAPATAPSTEAKPSKDKAVRSKAPVLGRGYAGGPPERAGFFTRLLACCGAGSQARGSDKTLRVDAKTPMANERTLLRWLRSAVLLSSLSAFLSSRSDSASRINGVLMALLSLLFVFGPLTIFRGRSLEMADAKAKKPSQDYLLQQLFGWSLALILMSTLVVDCLTRDMDMGMAEIPDVASTAGAGGGS
eukprot:TRINITY_DN2688_c0_g1_i2.p1 TRINITY_DN2688_c0_g1~~TRINITY_DN2688_c0_g1_i2.p1  ORF type:complete len:722 (-),score=173.05 TRINITY_DN2688_c0_g1_i2:226-2391(-)